MSRITIEAVVLRPIDVPRCLTYLDVRWRSGAVDELIVARPSAAEHKRTSSKAAEGIRELAARGLVNEAVAKMLNIENVTSGSGRSWSMGAVKGVRLTHKIASRGADTARPRTAARPPSRRALLDPWNHERIGGPHREVMRWVERGLVQGTHEDFGPHRSVWWLVIDETTAAQLDPRP